jgi:hypothetical protein
MARPTNANQGRKVEPTIPAGAYARLEHLAKMGMHGGNPTEVARFLIVESLTQLWREGKIPDKI